MYPEQARKYQPTNASPETVPKSFGPGMQPRKKGVMFRAMSLQARRGIKRGRNGNMWFVLRDPRAWFWDFA